jgi:hypothetical protein
MQPFYSQILFVGLCLEIIGGLLFIMGSVLGAYMLVSSTVLAHMHGVQRHFPHQELIPLADPVHWRRNLCNARLLEQSRPANAACRYSALLEGADPSALLGCLVPASRSFRSMQCCWPNATLHAPAAVFGHRLIVDSCVCFLRRSQLQLLLHHTGNALQLR